VENERILEHIIPEGQIEVWPSLGVENPLLRPATPIDPDNAECIDTRLFEIRSELSQIQVDQPITQTEPTLIEGLPPMSDSPAGIVIEKQVKRQQKEQKERSPRMYSEMLVVANDFQFLRNADDEAVGAFMSFMEANKGKITHLVLNGDIADMEQANKFGSTPDQAGTMADEIAAMNWFFNKMDRLLPDAKKVMIMGNHSARYGNYTANQTSGIEEWIKTPEEAWGIGSDWEVIPYAAGSYYKWHDRIFWHGHKSGKYVASQELTTAGVSVTTAHTNKNQYIEDRDALGNLKSGIVHGGFSRDNLHFMKTSNTKWSMGFGIYYWDKTVGEQPYSVIIRHGNGGRFIDPSGVIHDGAGYDLRREIGLDPMSRGRGRRK